MREILFRGKQVDNGEWVYGSLVVWDGDCYIAPHINSYTSKGGRGKGNRLLLGDFFLVDTSTVGECTNLTDENGKKIFEGDIVKHKKGVTSIGTEAVVSYEHGGIYPFSISGWECTFWAYYDVVENVRVIGNIHDNPEWLKE